MLRGTHVIHQCYLGQAVWVMSQSLFVLLQLPRHHLPCTEVETPQIYCVPKVTGQLRLTPELLPCRAEGRHKHGVRHIQVLAVNN